MKQDEQAGFSVFYTCAAVVVLVIIGAVSWRVVKHATQSAARNAPQHARTSQPTQSKTSPESTKNLATACASTEMLTSNPECIYYQLPEGVAAMTGRNIIEIPELNIHITVPDAIASFTYTVSTPGEGVVLASVTKDRCDLGALAIKPGQAPKKLTEGILVKQLSDFYITYTSPQSACPEAKTRAAVIQNLNDLATFKASLGSIVMP